MIGASGTIGNATFEAARKKKLNVLPTYRTRVMRGGLHFRLESDSHDVLNMKAGDAVIILAAFSDQEWIRTHPHQARTLNVDATARLAREATRRKVQVIFLSSEAVFGESCNAGWAETSLPCPATEYGRQKCEMETYLQSLDGTCIVRTGWNVSLRLGDRCVVRSTYEMLLNKSARLASDNVFSLTDVMDTATLLVYVAQERITGIVHAVSGVPTTRTAMANEIIRTSVKGKEMRYEEIQFADLKFGEPRPACAWLTTTHEALRKVPKFSLPEEIIAKKVSVLDEASSGQGGADRLR